MTDDTFKPRLYNVMDESGEVLYVGPINDCSHWVDLHARGKVDVERARRPAEKKKGQPHDD